MISRLKNTRILLVEDDHLLGLHWAEMLQDAGADVLGPVISSGDAATLLAHVNVDAGVLDWKLKGTDTSKVVASTLRARGIPFVFVSGSLQDEVSDREAPFLRKPVSEETLLGVIEVLVKGHPFDS